MDLKQLEYFVNVVDLGGFSRAARLLDIAQPAISRQVRSLEVELRQALLLRNGRGAVPTEAGKRLLEHARSILQQVDRAKRDVDGAKDAPIGRVVVGFPPTVARHLTAATVREFRRRHPASSLGVVDGLSAYIQEWLRVGRVDVGLVYNPTPAPDIEVRPLFTEPLSLIGPLQRKARPSPLKLRDLSRYPLIIPSRPHAIRALVEARLAAIGLRPQIAMEIDAVPAILDLVAEGHGYAVLSPRALDGERVARKLVARPIGPPKLASTIAIAVSALRPATPIQQAAVALIEQLAPRAMGRAAA